MIDHSDRVVKPNEKTVALVQAVQPHHFHLSLHQMTNPNQREGEGEGEKEGQRLYLLYLLFIIKSLPALLQTNRNGRQQQQSVVVLPPQILVVFPD